MSIAVARISESEHTYRIAGISHRPELLAILGKLASLVETGKELPEGILIPLLDGHNLILENTRTGLHSTVSGRSSLRGGTLLRPPALFEVGVNEYYAGHGLLLLGFLTLKDLEVNIDIIPNIVGDTVRKGMW